MNDPRRNLLVLTLAAVAVSGCTPPPEVPADLGATAEAIFRTFDTEPDNLAFLIQAAEDQMAEFDLDGDLSGREFQLQPMFPKGDDETPELDITYPADEDPARQAPILVVGRSRHAFADSILPALEDNQVCIESDTTVTYRRTWLENEACFKDGSCDVARTTNEVRKELGLGAIIIAAGWYDILKDLRRVELDDGRQAMVARGWTEKVWCGDNGNNRFAQTYTLEGWIEDGDTTKRFYAGWIEIDIGLNETQMKNLIAESFDEGFVFGDDWVDMDPGDYCPNDPAEEVEGEPTDTCK